MFIRLTVANGTKPLKCLVNMDKFSLWEERRNFEGKEVGANGYESVTLGSGRISVLETVDEIAKMIAAAPELLEALELVQGSYCLQINSQQETPDMKKARTMVGQAILKARGGTK